MRLLLSHYYIFIQIGLQRYCFFPIYANVLAFFFVITPKIIQNYKDFSKTILTIMANNEDNKDNYFAQKLHI